MSSTVLILTIIGTMAFALILSSIVRRLRESPPSEFATGVASSITSDPTSWDYDSIEYNLVCDKAAIEINIGYDFGKVKTLQRPNSGTSKITQFDKADLRLFKRAYAIWKKLTATDRQQIADRRKRDVLTALVAP